MSQALESGLTVRALARRPLTVTPREGLKVIEGDVRDSAAVASVVEGSDAVVSVFGQVKGSPPRLQTEGTRAIVEAMAERGVTRIVSLSGGGLRYPERDRPKTADRVIRTALKLLSPQVLADAEAHLAVLRASGVEWTVVRGPRLNDGPRAGIYRVGWVGVDASTTISRADLAEFILSELHDRRFIHQLPFVSY